MLHLKLDKKIPLRTGKSFIADFMLYRSEARKNPAVKASIGKDKDMMEYYEFRKNGYFLGLQHEDGYLTLKYDGPKEYLNQVIPSLGLSPKVYNAIQEELK